MLDTFKLGFGLMRLPKLADGKSEDIEQTKKMVNLFLATGGTYFDTAYVYDDRRSEQAVKERRWWTAIPGTATPWPPSCAPGSSATMRRAPSSSSTRAHEAARPPRCRVPPLRYTRNTQRTFSPTGYRAGSRGRDGLSQPLEAAFMIPSCRKPTARRLLPLSSGSV